MAIILHLILDQGVPGDASSLFRDLGYECTHVGEVGMSKASDDEILTWALSRNGIVVTLDADFHSILAVSGASGPSVIRLRLQGLHALELVQLIHKVLTEFEADIKNGCLVTVKVRKVTCHGLPIGRSE